jgi:hypothetical protein
MQVFPSSVHSRQRLESVPRAIGGNETEQQRGSRDELLNFIYRAARLDEFVGPWQQA